MDTLQVAVIGAGKMGLLHAGIFNSLKNSKLTAVSEKDEMIRRVGKKYMPNVHFYEDYEKMFKEECIDIVVITTPVFLHYPMIETAIDHNLNIFVEKPLSTNAKECRSILSRNFKGKSQVGYCRRFMGTYSFVKEILSQGLLGKVNYFDSRIFVSQVFSQGKGWQYDPAKSGGGALIDLGSHAIDMLHFLFGDISSVYANAGNVFNKDVEDYASLNLTLLNNIFGTLQISWSIKNFRMPELKIDIHCDQGKITVTEKYVEIFSDVECSPIKKGWNMFYKQDITPEVAVNLAGPEYTLEDQQLADAILHDTTPLCNFPEAAKASFVIDSAYTSIRCKSVEKIVYGV
jgi:predicted dehydrogenase